MPYMCWDVMSTSQSVQHISKQSINMNMNMSITCAHYDTYIYIRSQWRLYCMAEFKERITSRRWEKQPHLLRFRYITLERKNTGQTWHYVKMFRVCRVIWNDLIVRQCRRCSVRMVTVKAFSSLLYCLGRSPAPDCVQFKWLHTEACCTIIDRNKQ